MADRKARLSAPLIDTFAPDLFETSGEKINILLVDDTPQNLLALGAMLDRSDYNLVTASSGPEALGKILRYEFALILLDIFMPGMDGYEVATLIKERSKVRHVPIIFLTAMAKDIQNIYRAYEIGAVDYIQKPLEASIVRAKVEVFADLYRKTRENRVQAELLRQAQLRKKERELQTIKEKGEKKFQDLVEGIDHGIVWSADPETLQFSYISPRAEVILGYPVDQWKNERGFWNSHLYPDDREHVLSAFEKAREGQELGFEHRFFSARGQIIWFHTGVRLARRGAGEGSEIRGLSVDITRLKQTEEALREAVRLRDEFLSIASHELRTPITPIKLQLQLLMRALQKSDVSKFEPEALTKTLDTLDRQVERLSQLVDNLLDVSRMSSSGIALSLNKICLNEVVQEVVDRYTEGLGNSQLQIINHVGGEIFGNFDRLRLEQILVNLITNAIKYGRGKSVEIHLNCVKNKIRISIVDHGIGIKTEDQVRIFQRFERATSSASYGGLGLGLYITQQIVRAHGGTICLESEFGKGSKFVVELPLSLTKEMPVAKEALGGEN